MFEKLGVLYFESWVLVLVFIHDVFDTGYFLNIESQLLSVGLFFVVHGGLVFPFEYLDALFQQSVLLFELFDSFFWFDEQGLETLSLLEELVAFVEFEVVALLQFLFEFLDLLSQFDHFKLLCRECILSLDDLVHDFLPLVDWLALECV